MPFELPIAAAPRIPATPLRERADARRNRERILCAAARLIEAHGIEGVSMDAVAAEAGVGKGTLYRRFGDRASLVRALVNEEEAMLQESIIRGVPPLGPGAPALERLHAFGDELLQFFERRADFIAAAEAGIVGSRYAHNVYAFYRLHLGVLVEQILGEDDPRRSAFADALLGTLSAEMFLHQRHRRGQPLDEIRAGWHAVVDGLCRAAQRVPEKVGETF